MIKKQKGGRRKEKRKRERRRKEEIQRGEKRGSQSKKINDKIKKLF